MHFVSVQRKSVTLYMLAVFQSRAVNYCTASEYILQEWKSWGWGWGELYLYSIYPKMNRWEYIGKEIDCSHFALRNYSAICFHFENKNKWQYDSLEEKYFSYKAFLPQNEQLSISMLLTTKYIFQILNSEFYNFVKLKICVENYLLIKPKSTAMIKTIF